jgi:squalene-hopene/tetraprenyl-beta-curcumene cyclase
MKRTPRPHFPARLRSLAILIGLILLSGGAAPEEPRPGWRPDEAGKVLDAREEAWIAFAAAHRGEGSTESRCVSCHTVLPFALARPALRKLLGVPAPSRFENKLLAQTRTRVEHWASLDTEPFGLLYDSSERKKKESWGTEAVLNALILAWDDRFQGRASPSDGTKAALDHLWGAQASSGDHEGSWDWLDFNMGPWEGKEARFMGASMAAIAVGSAPGYAAQGSDAKAQEPVHRLRRYLKNRLPAQNLHNQAWGLWAASQLPGILSSAEQKELAGRLLARQEEDGGWCLSALGAWVRSDGTAQESGSDGYATGLVLHVLQAAGLPPGDPPIARGLDWLRSHQSRSGSWQGVSVNKKRDPASHTGLFMSDAATGFAILALCH